MKKVYLMLLCAMVALVACNKEESVINTSEDALFTLNVATQDGLKTRALTEVPEGFKARYILEIYNNDVLYKRIAQFEPQIEFRLVTNQGYDFLVWVDFVAEDATDANVDNYYNTTSLKAVTMNTENYSNNDHSRDAYFNTLSKTATQIGNQANSFDITCKRPFGQLNIITTDWDACQLISGSNSLTPDKVNISLTVYTQFNVFTGEVSQPVSVPLTYTLNQDFAGNVLADNKTRHLTCDYIFAPTEGSYVIPDTKVTLFNGDDKLTDTGSMLSQLPVKRNYKTNVSGNLLSKTGQVTIDVNATWENPDQEVDLTDPLP